MTRTIFFLLMILPATLFAQAGQTRSEVFRKEGPALQQLVDRAIAEVPGISVLQTAKAAYIEEYGVVISLEVALERPRDPFGGASSDRVSLTEKQKQIREKMRQFLTQKAPGLVSVGEDQSVTVVVHLFNSNPVDVPNLPRQLIISVKKREPTNVTMREL